MVNSNVDALGIIFPNSYDSLVPELVDERLMASIPFAGRYRMVDFLLSSMVNCGIDNIAILVRNNYHSLMDHLGSGREWDLTRKNGGLTIFPPYSEKAMKKMYGGRVEALASILDYIKDQKQKYVFLMDSNIAVNYDFNALLNRHIETGADVTIAYKEQELPAGYLDDHAAKSDFYYTLGLEDGRVCSAKINSHEEGLQNLAMNIYVVEREFLVKLIGEAFVHGHTYFMRDVLMPRFDEINVQALKFDGYVARISSMRSYFDENMKMLEDENVEGLFGPSPVYTKIRDDNPTRYISGAKVSHIMAADGCIVEGEVENSVLFRGVKIGKGAKVRNCVLMQDTVVEAGADLEYVISDKNVTVTANKQLKGTDTFPVFIAKQHTV